MKAKIVPNFDYRADKFNIKDARVRIGRCRITFLLFLFLEVFVVYREAERRCDQVGREAPGVGVIIVHRLAADCTPYVVNAAEKDRREAANKRYCTNEDWFGDECPETPCGFMEFESFKCEAGKCVGMALGR